MVINNYPIKIYKDFQDYNNILRDNNLDLMNAGYFPANDKLTEEDLDFKHNASLCMYALENLNIDNKTILDIACGRGGGPRVYKKYFNILDSYGCDINQQSINYANKKNQTNNYLVKDFETLNYDIKFDIITQIEASWHIKNYNLFYSSIKNILNQDGIFICLDYFTNAHKLKFEELANKFKYIKIYDITENIIKSCSIELQNLKNQNTDISNFLIEKYQSNYDALCNSDSKFLKYVCSDMELK
jgi:ubiquinone/menaquinone biosynthesis C-methylase UbiE